MCNFSRCINIASISSNKHSHDHIIEKVYFMDYTQHYGSTHSLSAIFFFQFFRIISFLTISIKTTSLNRFEFFFDESLCPQVKMMKLITKVHSDESCIRSFIYIHFWFCQVKIKKLCNRIILKISHSISTILIRKRFFFQFSLDKLRSQSQHFVAFIF